MKNQQTKFSKLIEFSKFLPNSESYIKKGEYGFIKETYAITNKTESAKYHKPIGKYTLLTLPKILDESIQPLKYYHKKFTESLSEYLGEITPSTTIMVIGLGNRHISSDSLGTEVVKNISITRGFSETLPKICAFAPSVLGLTGIETADTISALTGKIKPNIVIIIDSLCASHPSRLGISFQITNTAITPGSGIKNTRKKIDTAIKTISIGVPFVIYGDTFISSALNSLKNPPIIPKTHSSETLVTLSQIDHHVGIIGQFIANSINTAILRN